MAISKTDMAILGMLTLGPMSGYDMKQFCEKSLVHFWHESYGNLYPRLNRLAEAGLVVCRAEIRKRAPDAKVYRLTTRGRRHFRKWLQEPPAAERIRNELVLKLFFGAQAKPEIGTTLLEEQLNDQLKIRERYRAVEQMLTAFPEDDPNRKYWLVTLRRGQLLTEARIQWCRESLIMLRENHNTQEVA